MRFILLLLVTVVGVGASSATNGSPDCPCIDPYPLSGPGTNASDCTGILHSSGVCYNIDYGSRGCRAYDLAATEACLGREPPSWCLDTWCWVADWACHKPRAPSAFFRGVTTDNASMVAEANGGSTLLTYSYETCGNIDTFTYENGIVTLLDDIRNRGPLRISIPGDEPPYIVTRRPDQTFVQGTSYRDGSIVRFVTDILNMPRPGDAPLPWVEVPITPESRAYSPSSSFTACVHDVALNNTDICVGSFWAFEFRRRLAAFTSPIENVRFYVIARQRNMAQMFDQLLLRPFVPFTPLMWASMFVALIYAGYAIYTLDATGFPDAEEDDQPPEHGARVPCSGTGARAR